MQRDGGDDVLVDALEEVGEDVADGETERVHADASLAAGVGVEQRRLDGEGGHRQRGLDCKLQHRRRVRVTHRRHHQIRVRQREVPVERRHTGSLWHPHAQHGLEARLTRQVVEDVSVERLREWPCAVEGGVEEELAAGDAAEGGERGHVRILRSAGEHVDGDLLVHQRGRQLAVERAAGTQQVLLALAGRHGRLAHLQLALAAGGQRGLEEQQLAAAVLQQLACELERVQRAGLHVLGGSDASGQRVEETLDGGTVVGEGEEEGAGQREERLLHLAHHQLSRRGVVLRGRKKRRLPRADRSAPRCRRPGRPR